MVIVQRHATQGYVIARHSVRVAILMIAERTKESPATIQATLLKRAIRTDNGPIPSTWSV